MPHRDRSPLQDRVTRVVRTLMVAHAESQSDVAAALHIEQGPLSRKMSGQSRWSLEDLELLAVHFSIAPASFFEDPRDLVVGASPPLSGLVAALDRRQPGTDRRRVPAA